MVVLAFFVGSCKSSEKKIISKHPNGSPETVYELPDRTDTLNYTLKIYYPDGHLKRTAQVTNGKYTGIIKTYFNNGKLYQLDSIIDACNVTTGACDEYLIRFNENGTLSQRFTVKAGIFNGSSQQFNQKGLLSKEYDLVNDTIKNGPYKEFYDNGKVLRSATYHMDTLIGFEYIFKENGDTLKYFSHYQGQMDFPYKIWLDDGNTATGVRLKGEMVLWTWYDKKGNIIKKQTTAPSKSGYILAH